MVRRRQGRPRALQRRRARRDRAPAPTSGYEVFVDLKLHDIPTTVGKARPRARRRSAPRYLTLHARGGVDMLRAGVEGLARRREARRAARRRRRSRSPCSPATASAPPHILPKRVRRRRRGRLRRHRLRGRRRARGTPVRARACSRSCPASGPPAPTDHDQARAGHARRGARRRRRPPGVGRAVTQAADPVARPRPRWPAGLHPSRAEPRPRRAADAATCCG